MALRWVIKAENNGTIEKKPIVKQIYEIRKPCHFFMPVTIFFKFHGYKKRRKCMTKSLARTYYINGAICTPACLQCNQNPNNTLNKISANCL